MPIYEYQCTGCGKIFEIFQRISDEPLTTCKECKGKLSKLISNCAFHLKGTGWYATDYKKSGDSVNGKNAGKKTDEITASSTESVAAPESKSETASAVADTEKKPKKEKKRSETTGGQS